MSDDPSLADLHGNARLIWLIDRARQRVFREMERALKREDAVSVAQAAALIVIGFKNDVSMRDLAVTLDIGQPAVTGLVRRMEERGLVSRVHDSRDARIQRLTLSEAGQEARRQAMDVISAVNDTLESSLEHEASGRLGGVLEQIAQTPPIMDVPAGQAQKLTHQA